MNKKPSLKYINLICKNVLFIALIMLISCNSNYDKLNEYINKNGFEIDSIHSIFILQENQCVACNKAFSLLVQKHFNKKNTLSVISAKGISLDISPFLKHNNIILDYNLEFNKTGIVKNSAMIFLKNNKIDTIVNIKAKDLENRLKYISSRL